MSLPYHYSKHEDIDKVLDQKLGITHKEQRYTLKSMSKTLRRRTHGSLFFDYTIVGRFDNLSETVEEALFQSQLAPRTRFIIVDNRTHTVIEQYLSGKRSPTAEEMLYKAIKGKYPYEELT